MFSPLSGLYVEYMYMISGPTQRAAVKRILRAGGVKNLSKTVAKIMRGENMDDCPQSQATTWTPARSCIQIEGKFFDFDFPPTTWTKKQTVAALKLPRPPGRWRPYQGVYIITPSFGVIRAHMPEVLAKIPEGRRPAVALYAKCLYRAPENFMFFTVGDVERMEDYRLIAQIVHARKGINVGL